MLLEAVKQNAGQSLLLFGFKGRQLTFLQEVTHPMLVQLVTDGLSEGCRKICTEDSNSNCKQKSSDVSS